MILLYLKLKNTGLVVLASRIEKAQVAGKSSITLLKKISNMPNVEPKALDLEVTPKVPVILSKKKLFSPMPDFALWNGDVEAFLKMLPKEPIFDLIVSSPPYNIGKVYEMRSTLEVYLKWQKRIIKQMIPRLKDTGSICWQVGNFVDNGQIVPLDIEFAPLFKKHKLQMRNRIIWRFGHGLHTKRRFSGRYETVMWYIPRRMITSSTLMMCACLQVPRRKTLQRG